VKSRLVTCGCCGRMTYGVIKPYAGFYACARCDLVKTRRFEGDGNEQGVSGAPHEEPRWRKAIRSATRLARSWFAT
jgi:hypothetical protein